MKRLYILSMIFLFLASTNGFGQNCYIRMDDASGFNTDPYQTELNTAACELKDIIPAEFQNDFKVFSFGFYLHNEVFEGSFPPVFEQAITQAAQASPYYVLIGRQTDGTGVYTKFWADIKLPESAEYPCVDEELMANLEIAFTTEIERVYNSYNRNASDYYHGELEGLDYLSFLASHAYYCCDEGGSGFRTECNSECRKEDYSEITQFLNSYNYIRLENLSLEVEEIPEVEYANITTNRNDLKYTYSFDESIYDQLNTPIGERDWLTQGGDFVDELAQFSINAQIVGEINVRYFDEFNCNELFFELEGAPGDPTVDNYSERIIILKIGNQPAIAFSRIFTLGISLQGLEGEVVDRNSSVIIPALIAREVLKRAISATVSVAINVMIEVAMEKYFAHGNDCTWTDAWESSKITMWDVFIWSWEGVLGNDIVSIGGQALLGAVSETMRYIMNTESFELNTALSTFALGLASGVAVGLGVKYVSRAFDKYTIKYLANKYGVIPESIALKFDEFWNLLIWTFTDPKMVETWEQVMELVEVRVKKEILETAKSWSSGLMNKFKSSCINNTDFYEKVSKFPIIANYFEEGFPLLSKNSNISKEVELDMYALDRSRPDRNPEVNSIFESSNPTSYVENFTKKDLLNPSDININSQSGKIRYAGNPNELHTTGEGFMFVVDEFDNILIGGRGGELNSFPHPTLVGGVNPNVKCAGMIKFKHGRILEINNNSGHFKPSSANLDQVKPLFEASFQSNSFDSAFNFVNVAP